MTGMERLSKLGKELWWIFKPHDEASTWGLILLVIMVVAAFVARKQFGGFFKGFFKMLGIWVFLAIVHSISPIAMWVLLGLGLVLGLCEKLHIPITRILTGMAVVGAAALAIYHTFWA